MTLVEKLYFMYPELETMDAFNPFTGCITLQDDSNGKGPYIKTWNYIKPKPTKKQLCQIKK